MALRNTDHWTFLWIRILPVNREHNWQNNRLLTTRKMCVNAAANNHSYYKYSCLRWGFRPNLRLSALFHIKTFWQTDDWCQRANNENACCIFDVSNSCTHLKRKSRLLIVDPDKDLSNYQLFAVIIEHKLCTKAFIIFSLKRNHREDAWILNSLSIIYMIVWIYSIFLYKQLQRWPFL